MKLFYLLPLCFFILVSCAKDDSVLTKDLNQKIDSRAPATICQADVINPINQGVVTGSAQLIRTNSKVSMTMQIDSLIAGHTYTVWWVIWNQPQNCTVEFECSDADFGIPDDVEVEVLYAAGHLVGASGQGNFAGSLKENDTDGSINADFGLDSYGGLQDARTAEVHLVLRSHGPAIPGQVNEQISTYGGGCTTYYGFDPFTEIPDEEGECGDIFFAVFPADCGD